MAKAKTPAVKDLPNIFDDDERDAERDRETPGRALVAVPTHAAGADAQCPVCKDSTKITVVEALYSRGEPLSDIADLVDIPWQKIRAHCRGLNLDIALSKDTDRALAVIITQGLNDIRPHSVDAKVTLEAIKLRATIDGKVVQRVHMDRPSTIIFVGDSPEPGVADPKVVRGTVSGPPIELDVPDPETLVATFEKESEE